MRTLKYEKWVFIGAAISMLASVFSPAMGICGMMLQILIVLMGIIRFLMENNR